MTTCRPVFTIIRYFLPFNNLDVPETYISTVLLNELSVQELKRHAATFLTSRGISWKGGCCQRPGSGSCQEGPGNVNYSMYYQLRETFHSYFSTEPYQCVANIIVCAITLPLFLMSKFLTLYTCAMSRNDSFFNFYIHSFCCVF